MFRYIKKQWLKVLEALLVAFFTASAGAASIYFLDDYCHSDTEESLKFAVRVGSNTVSSMLYYRYNYNSVNGSFGC